MVNDRTEACSGIADRGVLEHGHVSIAIAEAYDGSSTDRLMDSRGLSCFIIDEQLFQCFDQDWSSVSELELGFG
jgi:hypothetical protein